MACGERAIGFFVFFREDFDAGEIFGEAGALELGGLLFVIAFRDQDETVARGEDGYGLGYSGEKVDGMGDYGFGEADDAFVVFGRDGRGGELLGAGDERVAKASETVATGGDAGALAGVESLADFGGRVGAVVEPAEEGGDGALEVDVVLPEGIVGVDQQGLGDEAGGGGSRHSV